MSQAIITAKRELEAELSAAQAERVEIDERISNIEFRLEKFNEAFPDLSDSTPVVAKPKKVTSKKAGKGKRAKKGEDGAMLANMRKVIGRETVSAQDVVDRLKAQDLAPDSKNLRAYVSSVFSTSTDSDGNPVFERVSRGQYRVASAATDETPVDSTPAAPEAPEASDEDPSSQVLAEAGIDLNSLGLAASPSA